MLLNQVIRQALSVPLCSQQLSCVLTVENMKEQTRTKYSWHNHLPVLVYHSKACINIIKKVYRHVEVLFNLYQHQIDQKLLKLNLYET